MTNQEYKNNKEIFGTVVSIDPMRYRKNKKQTPVLNAVIETRRIYGDNHKVDRHKIAIFGESAFDFEERVRVDDWVFVEGYTFSRERKFTNEEGEQVQVIEDTLCAEHWIPASYLTEQPF